MLPADTPPKHYRVSVKALITDEDNRLLMIQERGDHWSIPGGGLEHGEEIEVGLRREIYEELGVEVTSIAKQPAFVWTSQNGKGGWCLCICYPVTVESFGFTLADDVQATKFFEPEELIKAEIDPGEQPIARHYYNHGQRGFSDQ